MSVIGYLPGGTGGAQMRRAWKPQEAGIEETMAYSHVTQYDAVLRMHCGIREAEADEEDLGRLACDASVVD